MFRGGTNPYDEIVAKTTDENLTGENWELILNLCDKVTEEGEAGARNVIASVLKRLQHRLPNVQIYALSLADSLSKNCGLEVNKEIASRSFTQGLERLVTDRTTNDKVKKKALALILEWSGEFEKDPALSIMEECMQNLKSKNIKFDHLEEAPPPQEDDSIRRREEEELQRVLELSVTDKGGRGNWVGGYAAGGGGASSSSALPSSSRTTDISTSVNNTSAPAYSSSKPTVVPTSTAVPKPLNNSHDIGFHPRAASPPKANAQPRETQSSPVPATVASQPTVSRVRALHPFEPSELGELAFEKGDIIRVVDRGYKDWWRGQLRGKTGIFPVNYVEPLPEPTPMDLQRDAEMEALVFGQAASIDQLLNMLRGLDPQKDNLADNDELQELYRQGMGLRPKIVKLIDKYSQKKMELTSMNENFVKARQMFDTMMEESLAKHNPGAAVYDWRNAPQNRPDSRNQGAPYDYQSIYGWNPQLMGQQGPQGPPPIAQYPAAYAQQVPNYAPTPAPQTQQGPYPPQNAPAHAVDYVQQPYGPPPAVDPQSAYAQQYPPTTQQPPPGAHPPYQMTDGGQPQQQLPQYGNTQQQTNYPQAQQQLHPQTQSQAPTQPQPQQNANAYQPPAGQPQMLNAQTPSQSNVHQAVPQQQAPQLQQTQPTAVQPQPQQQQQQQQQLPQQQSMEQSGPTPQQSIDQQHPQLQQAQAQQTATPTQQQGPPYVWDPQGVYPDEGAQAWAQYYAQGGNDPAGRIYFTPESLAKLDAGPVSQPTPGEAYTQGQPTLAFTQASPDSAGLGNHNGIQSTQPYGESVPGYGNHPGGVAPAQGFNPSDPHYQQQYAGMQQGFAQMGVSDPAHQPA